MYIKHKQNRSLSHRIPRKDQLNPIHDDLPASVQRITLTETIQWESDSMHMGSTADFPRYFRNLHHNNCDSLRYRGDEKAEMNRNNNVRKQWNISGDESVTTDLVSLIFLMQFSLSRLLSEFPDICSKFIKQFTRLHICYYIYMELRIQLSDEFYKT